MIKSFYLWTLPWVKNKTFLMKSCMSFLVSMIRIQSNCLMECISDRRSERWYLWLQWTELLSVYSGTDRCNGSWYTRCPCNAFLLASIRKRSVNVWMSSDIIGAAEPRICGHVHQSWRWWQKGDLVSVPVGAISEHTLTTISFLLIKQLRFACCWCTLP